MLSRRTMLLTPVALAAARGAPAAASKMTLAIHQNTSSRAGFRQSLEGWSRAGIRQVEIAGNLLDEFLKTESLATAHRLLTDLGLTPVSCNGGALQGLWEQNPNRPAALDALKKRCEMFATLGLKRIYSTTATPQQKVTAEDYKPVPDSMREVGEIARQFDMTAMAEFIRTSPLISTLPTLLKMTRAAGHPNMRPMLDCYHFWSGLNKLEDLDLLKPGELGHVHFQDVPDMPRELLDTVTRVIAGGRAASCHRPGRDADRDGEARRPAGTRQGRARGRLDVLERHDRRLSSHCFEDAEGDVERGGGNRPRRRAIPAARDHQSGHRGRPRSAAPAVRHRARHERGESRRVQEPLPRGGVRQQSARLEADGSHRGGRERGQRSERAPRRALRGRRSAARRGPERDQNLHARKSRRGRDWLERHVERRGRSDRAVPHGIRDRRRGNGNGLGRADREAVERAVPRHPRRVRQHHERRRVRSEDQRSVRGLRLRRRQGVRPHAEAIAARRRPSVLPAAKTARANATAGLFIAKAP